MLPGVRVSGWVRSCPLIKGISKSTLLIKSVLKDFSNAPVPTFSGKVFLGDCMNLKKVLIFILILLLPCFLFLEIWGGYRYNKKEKEIGNLEKEQTEWIEENKSIIADIAVYSSPDRIKQMAEEDLGLVPVDNTEKSKIVVNNENNKE